MELVSTMTLRTSQSYPAVELLQKPSLPLQQLLDSFSPPSSTQRDHIHHLLHGAEQDLFRLTTHIDGVAGLLLSLQALQVKHSSSVNKYKAALSPFRGIPVEVMVRIFLFADAVNDRAPTQPSPNLKYTRHNSLDVRRGVWAFSQVCRQWRETCLSFPELWSHPEVICDSTLRNGKHWPTIISTFMQRSGQWMMDLFLWMDQSDAQHLAPIIAGTSHRWRSVHLHVPARVLQHLDSSIPPSCHVPVRSLHIEALPDSHDITSVSIRRLGGAYNLRQAHLIGYPLTLFAFNWSTVTKLVIAEKQTLWKHSYITMLTHASSLEELDFCGGPSEDIDFTLVGEDPEPVVVPRLRCIKLGSSTLSALDSLSLPSLAHVYLSSSQAGSGYLRPLVNLLARTACTMETFSLESRYLDTEEVLELLSLVPSLVHLHLGGYYPTITPLPSADSRHLATLLAHLASKDEGGLMALLPALERLDIVLSPALNLQLLENVISSRIQALRRVELIQQMATLVGDMIPLTEFAREKGIDVQYVVDPSFQGALLSYPERN